MEDNYMRTLVLLRGIPASGKSTWIKENKLEAYTLSSDHIRTLYQAPSLNVKGESILYDYESTKVWKTLYEMLETRMSHGEFVIVDATNTTKKEIMKYKTLAKKYRYRIYCVDFSDITIETAKERNASREPFKRVPDNVIDRMYTRLQENIELPSGIKMIKPEEIDELLIKPMDLSSYKKIHHIGDIHGCYTVLMEYLKEGIKDDEFYIFLGDYIDRGIENANVVKFVTSLINHKNVLFLEGNHEKWLRMWADCEVSYSKEFEEKTRKELEKENVKRKSCREFCRKLAQCAYYKYNEKTFFVSHAGVSTIPGNPLFISAKQMIEGVGGYDDVETIEQTFDETMPDDFYQIHGHRNRNLPVHSSARNYDLEGQVEFGGFLRCVQIDEDGIHAIETPNEEYNRFEVIKTVKDAIQAFRNDPDIKEKKFGNISSFNFTRNAFDNKRWNTRTVTARGLYINTAEERIIARGYNKFFNMEEAESTKMLNLQRNLTYPLHAYVKENGYLGIIGLDTASNDLFITSKSDITGDYALWFKELFLKKTTAETRENMIEYIKEHDVTCLFEVVDIEHDPHIIDYDESEIYLLDIVKNDLHFSKLDYNELFAIASLFSLKCKKIAYTINSWNDFLKWNEMISSQDYKYRGKYIEGFVIEDSSGFMFKKKCDYYRNWKLLRGIKDRILAGHAVNYDSLTKEQCDFCDFVKTLKDKENLNPNICHLRKIFYESRKQ
jgi:predicted kinase